MFFKNKVKEAVDKAGGPTYTAIQPKFAGTTIHTWCRNSRVSSIEKVKLLSELSGVDLLEIRPC